MQDSIIIVGAGGHGRVCAEVAERCGFNVAGFCDPAFRTGEQVDGIPVISGADADLFAAWPEGHRLIVGLGDNVARLHCALTAQRAQVPFAILVDPSAIVSDTAKLAPGTVVMPRAVINAGAETGLCTVLNTACVVEHDCKLADAVLVGPGANLSGGVSVGECTLIGTGASVVPGVSIGEDVTVASGAAVSEDVLDGITVGGVPARPLAR